MKARQEAEVSDTIPICPYDFAVSRGVGVRFMAASSMEGIYDRQSQTIIVSSLRPRGRRAFTCAHEYGHHIFGHGTHIDELPEDRQGPRSPEELLVDRFAGFLLMPRLAVVNGFRARGIRPEKCTPVDAYRVSCWLGVSYDAFLTHASLAVSVMPLTVAEALKKVPPKEIKEQLASSSSTGDLIVVDRHWTDAVDLVVGDDAILPAGTTIEGTVMESINETPEASYFHATSRGIGRAISGKWAVNIRVMPSEYTGLARCRHIPETNDG
jgi:Zn-dependent peptidase ImmA (M78 family)